MVSEDESRCPAPDSPFASRSSEAQRGTGEIKPSRGANLSADEGSLLIGRTTKKRLLMTRVTAAACSIML